jgi:hypothetical protein
LFSLRKGAHANLGVIVGLDRRREVQSPLVLVGAYSGLTLRGKGSRFARARGNESLRESISQEGVQ